METKFIIIILCASFGVSTLLAQDQTKADKYQYQFTEASPDTRLQLLELGLKEESGTMGPLFHLALDYTADNAHLLGINYKIRKMAQLSFKGIIKEHYSDATPSLWYLFQRDEQQALSIETIHTLGIVADKDPQIIAYMNAWLSDRNAVFTKGFVLNKQLMTEMVYALGKQKSATSFPLLIYTQSLRISSHTTKACEESIKVLDGKYSDMSVKMIKTNKIEHKLIALKAALNNSELNSEVKSIIAQAALKEGIKFSSLDAESRSNIKEIRHLATLELTENKWEKATPTVISAFRTALDEYNRDISSYIFLLESIHCLQAMNNQDAAEELTSFMKLINKWVENDDSMEDEITIVLISALGQIADKTALNELEKAQYLNYSPKVKNYLKSSIRKIKR